MSSAHGGEKMAIEIRKLPKWEETNTDGKLRIINNSITNLSLFTVIIFIVVIISFISISGVLLGIDSKGDIIFLIITLLITYLFLTFSVFFEIRKVK